MKKKGWEVDKLDNSLCTYTIKKKFDYDKIKEYAKQFITIKQDNIIFKFNIPDYYKPMVQDILKSKPKKEVYPLITTNEHSVKE